MGLDMYLNASKYISGRDEKKAYAKIMSDIGMEGFECTDMPSMTVDIRVAYWRKANAIHRWFVDHCQSGTDDCGTYDVNRSQLIALRDLCKELVSQLKTEPGKVLSGTTYCPDGTTKRHYENGRVIVNLELAAKLLPTQGGFFFGSTEYDEWYLQSVEETITKLNAALDPRLEDFQFTYRSSW